MHAIKRFAGWMIRTISSAIILALLIFVVVNFYIFASVVDSESFFYVFLVLSIAIDGLLVLVHLPRKYHKHQKLSFDPSKLTILISCFNGEDLIGETIRDAKRHVPADQIIVISDASTDNTYEVAKAEGVRVYRNEVNLHKAFTISRGVHAVKTPYVLVMDDDTLIGDTFIPTSLLDEGYTAVSFDVMPLHEDNVLNAMQQFEYRKSMQIGKNLRAKAGAIGNVSGAIGLFHTSELRRQTRVHSGQFGGEDEQRTLLAHLQHSGKGITYTDSTVLTKPPATLKKLFRQRAFSWNLSIPELFVLYWRILLHPDKHFLLKAEKAYAMYIFLTDPLRMLFFWLLFVQPDRIFAAYGFYVTLSLVIWLKTKRKDPLWVVLTFPLYNLFTSFCRFVAHFHWYRVKFRYIFQKKYHRFVTSRRLLMEYATVAVVMVVFWVFSLAHFNADMRLWNKIRSNRLDDLAPGSFEYTELDQSAAAEEPEVPADNTSIEVVVSDGDTVGMIARKALDAMLVERPDLQVPDSHREKIVQLLASRLAPMGDHETSPTTRVDRELIVQTIVEGLAG